MTKQFRKNEIEAILQLMKDVDFEDIKANYAITRNERKMRKELKEIEEDIKAQETAEARLKTQMTVNSFGYDIELYSIKQFPEKDNLTLKEAFLLQLFAEKPKGFPQDVIFKNDRSDYFRALGIAKTVQDVELQKEVALKIGYNLVSFMNIARELNESEIAQKQAQLAIEQQLMILKEYKKDKEGNVVIKDDRPVLKDEEKANKKLEAFDKKHKDDYKAYNDWLTKEQVDFSFAGISLDDLPEDVSKKQMEVLIQFIKEEE